MDVGIGLLEGIEDALVAPPGMLGTHEIIHPFTGIQITDKGIDLLCQYVADVRDEMGYEVPRAVDHFGHIGVESCIRLGKALDQFSLAWYEDIYLNEDYEPLIERRALSVIHPDMASSGGILETKKIGDMA